MADLEKLAEQLSELTVLEAAELTEILEEKWGVSAAAPMAMAAAPAAGGGAAEVAEEKSEFDVVIKDVGPKKIDVIKAIRQITTLGLKDAKDLAETADAKVLEAVGKEAAEDAQKKLEEAGASVELA
jgi:large subunit ribosomal protein L7/L12